MKLQSSTNLISVKDSIKDFSFIKSLETIEDALFFTMFYMTNDIAGHSIQEVIDIKRKAVELSFDDKKILINPRLHPLYAQLSDRAKDRIDNLFNEVVSEYRYTFLVYQGWVGGSNRVSEHILPQKIKDLIFIPLNEKRDALEEDYGSKDAYLLRAIAGDIGRRITHIKERIGEMVYNSY